MDNVNDTEAEGPLELQERYANAYNEIVQPDRVFVATQYFRTRWVPILGPALGWLILALRQRCYWNRQTGEIRDKCTVSQDDLAAETGLDRSAVSKLLRKPYADRFIRQIKPGYGYNRRLGKTVRTDTLYVLRMDDPLTPEDEETLRARIKQQADGIAEDAATGQLDMLTRLEQLIHQGDLCWDSDAGEVVAREPGQEAGDCDPGPVAEQVQGGADLNAKTHIDEGTYVPKCTQVGPPTCQNAHRSGITYVPKAATTTSTYSTDALKREEDDIWARVKAALQLELTKATYDTWVKPTRAERKDSRWRIVCTNGQAQDWLAHRLKGTIQRALEWVVGSPVELEFAVM